MQELISNAFTISRRQIIPEANHLLWVTLTILIIFKFWVPLNVKLNKVKKEISDP